MVTLLVLVVVVIAVSVIDIAEPGKATILDPTGATINNPVYFMTEVNTSAQITINAVNCCKHAVKLASEHEHHLELVVTLYEIVKIVGEFLDKGVIL
jgi:hypothetical protein